MNFFLKINFIKKIITKIISLIFFVFFFSFTSKAQLIHDFRVNDDTALISGKYNARISTNKYGYSAIIWEEQLPTLKNIFAQIYDINFIKINNNFKINSFADTIGGPDIVINDKNLIGIVWQKHGIILNNTYTYASRTFFRMYNVYGFPITSYIQLNDSLKSYDGYPRIGSDSFGRFIVTWLYTYGSVYFQILDSVGNKIGNNVRVNDYNTNGGIPDILVRKDGSFIIVWADYRGPGVNIYMQVFNRNGIPVGINQMVNDTIGQYDNCNNPKIVQDSSGNFVVAFNEYILNANWNFIKYQRYDKYGLKIGYNKEIYGSPGQFYLSSFDSDETGNLVFQFNFPNAVNYHVYNLRIDKYDNPIGTYFPVSNEFISSGKTAEDINLFNRKIINVWRDIRLSTQPQIYANIRSFINPDSTIGIVNITNELPDEFKLFQNYPNPFNTNTIISFEIYKIGNYKIEVYDILGKIIIEYSYVNLKPGMYKISFKGENLSSGMYYYRISNTKSSLEKKMFLIK